MNRRPLVNVLANTENLRRIRKQPKLRRAPMPSRYTQHNTGRWEEYEKLAFLRGLRLYGRGNWKAIGSLIPTRNTIQVKSHAQQMIQKLDEGIDIFEKLDGGLKRKTSPNTNNISVDEYLLRWKLSHSERDIDAATTLLLMASM
eukprot:scaffold2362_cov109-Cylindrotheca_fusiformis.AAC.4